MSERLIDAMRPVVADLARCVARTDRAGFTLLTARKTTQELHALLILALECADEEKLAVVTERCRDCGSPLRQRQDGDGYYGSAGRCPSCASQQVKGRAARRRAA